MKKLGVGFQDAVENDDRVRRGVAMTLRAKIRRVANQVVLGTRLRILVQETQTYRAVIDDRLGGRQLERREIVLEHASEPMPQARARGVIGRWRVMAQQLARPFVDD